MYYYWLLLLGWVLTLINAYYNRKLIAPPEHPSEWTEQMLCWYRAYYRELTARGVQLVTRWWIGIIVVFILIGATQFVILAALNLWYHLMCSKRMQELHHPVPNH